ncbi:uncharacterized protein PV09_05335 [Verruconis gallopava]|uniref:Fe2OG dioxygenase domain-containing protein n=1 Tax=Verruconis gallopava TaxID=253628 RepID=A0A0D2AAJ2_9PEZI|nr:uncharacterized protein PV09_05335 [Verruconis gallopava]KIW03580.1 hypothetical protein PV09_05335 [Verruconis gallopava]
MGEIHVENDKKLFPKRVEFVSRHENELVYGAKTRDIKEWAQEIHDWKPTQDSAFMPYEEINARGERVLCRTENFVDVHRGFNDLLRSEKLLNILAQLSGEPMLLFKEKINYKLSGSGGFAPHIDAVAYTHVKNIKHLTILLAVDETNMKNGGLEVVDGSNAMDIPINEKDHCISQDWVKEQIWTPAELEPGQLLIFGSYLAHRSGVNASSGSRKAIYATYNCAKEGDLRKAYYEDRARLWPATHKRKEGESYAEGSLRYGFGSPMLSVESGRQLVF